MGGLEICQLLMACLCSYLCGVYLEKREYGWALFELALAIINAVSIFI